MRSAHVARFYAHFFARFMRTCATMIFIAACAKNVASQDSRKLLSDKLDAVTQQAIKAYNIPGLSIAVIQHGKIVVAKNYGLADVENQVPITSKTLFRIGSITKTISATAALMLEERHQIDLDAPVQRYCPAFPEKQWPLTTRQLLAHTGGIRSFRTEGGISPELLSDSHYQRVAESLALFAGDPLIAEPGSRYEYSNYGYDLVGCVLEGASGLDFGDLLRKLIFSPISMTSTTLDDSESIIPGRSRNYTHAKDGSIHNAKSIDTSNRIPAAGLLSTASDLARFVIALQSGKLLSSNSLHQMWTEQSTSDGKRTSYALGWMIHDVGGTSVVAHTGEQPGSSSLLCVFPESQSAFVVLANTDAAGLWKWAGRVAELIQ